MSRPPGRGSALSLDQKKEVQRLHFIEELPVSAIAKKVNRDRSSIRRVLQSDESKKLRLQLESDNKDDKAEVLRLLRASGPAAAREWARSIEQAASRGDHRPALSLLLHARLLDVLEGDAPHTGITIIVGTPEAPITPPNSLPMLSAKREGEDDGS